MKKIINLLLLIIFCLVCLTGCKTIVKYKYIYPELPDFNVERPVNPDLDPIPQDAAYEEALRVMSVNLIKLMDVNSQHVLYEDTFLEFYQNIQQSLENQAETGEY